MAIQQAKRFLALLRGINVGGNNLIAKDQLRGCFEQLGLTSVRTYIQSGNILFRADTTSIRGLTTAIEDGLSNRFNYAAQAVVLSHEKYRAAVAAAPDEWGHDDQRKHNALFTLNGITPKQVLSQLPAPKLEIETVTIGPGVIFWSASKKALARTTMMKLASSTAYKQMTVRNHNTVFKIMELLESL